MNATATATASAAQIIDGTLVTGTDPRARLHVIKDGAVACGSTAPALATLADLDGRKMCFFCDTVQASPVTEDEPEAEAEVEVAEPVTLRIAEALVGHFAENIPAVAAALPHAPTRKVGKGATYFVTLARTDAEQVLAHLVERLGHRRTGLGIERFRAERALRMIQSDLNA